MRIVVRLVSKVVLSVSESDCHITEVTLTRREQVKLYLNLSHPPGSEGMHRSQY